MMEISNRMMAIAVTVPVRPIRYFRTTIKICSKSLFLYNAALFKERNTVAKNLIVVVLILLCIHSVINSLQSRITLALQIFQNLRVLCLKDCNAGMLTVDPLYEPIFFPALIISNIDQGIAALAVALKTKDSNLKSTGFSTAVTAVVAGVTEPAMYAINLKYAMRTI